MVFRTFITSTFFFVTFVYNIQASESDDSGASTGGPQSFSLEVVKAWRAAGGYPGYFGISQLDDLHCPPEFWQTNKPFAGFGFSFDSGKCKTAPLPDPKIPFGVAFFETDDEHLSRLKNMKSLTGLDLGYANFSADGFKMLGEMTQLERLAVGRASRPFEIGELAKLKNLKFLSLGSLEGVESIKELKKLPHLEHLGLSYCEGLNEKFLSEVCELKNLKILSLYETKLSDAEIVHLKKLKNLQELTLSRNNITRKGLEHILEIKSLKALKLQKVPLNDDDLKLLFEKLPDLEYLAIGDLKITDAGIKDITKLKKLRQLELGKHSLSEKGFQKICEVKSLESIRFFYSHFDKGFSQHLPLLVNLKKLNLEDSNISDKDLVFVGKLAQLEELNIGNTPITDEGIAELHRLKKLFVLSVGRSKITSKGIAAFATERPMCRVHH